MKQSFIKEFINPGSEYRGAPFWAWNGKLDKNELRRQIRLMHEMGLGGFFMHSRVGLDTEYLSDEWFSCIEACVDEAEKLDMQAWLYDEDRWPSGAAGGLVTKNPEYRMRHLRMTEITSLKEIKSESKYIALYVAEIIGNNITSYRRITKKSIPKRLSENQKILKADINLDDNESWYNGFTYLDTLNDKAVKEFIKVTHQEYADKIGDKFGKRVPGIFTDEPNYGRMCPNGEPKIPWTGTLLEVFNKRYGYDLLDYLPELFYNVDNVKVSKARYHYCDCLTHLFVTAFAKQIGDWCDRHNMLHTGHVLEEDTLSRQVTVVGSCMRFYEYMQAPGMDLLTEHWRVYDTAKQVSSAARQFNRKWRLTETYGCSGWDFSFEGHKALGDWQAALGINLRCQHLAWYTMQGEAKRDYPASISYQSPWWESYSKVEDYFARINLIMTKGKEVRDILVIHPVESTWTFINTHWCGASEVTAFDDKIIKLRDTLLKNNLDFDYGDEEIMSRHSKISKKNNQPIFSVGDADYKIIIVPDMITMRSTTLRLLEEFKASGGTVLFAGSIPAFIDAESSSAVESFAESCIKARHKKIVEVIDKQARRVSIKDDNDNEINPTLYQMREDVNNIYLFVCNTGHNINNKNFDEPLVRERTATFPEVTITLFGATKGDPLELDPETGNMFMADSVIDGANTIIYTDLAKIGSRLFIIPKKAQKCLLPKKEKLTETGKKTFNSKQWNIIRSEDNVLVLDMPKYKIGNKKWKAPKEILQIDIDIRDVLNIQHRGGQMVQPWARAKNEITKSEIIKLSYSISINTIPATTVYLAMETPDAFSVTLNGTKLSTDMECGWWCDISLRKLAINPSLFHKGENQLILECNYNESHSGFEAIYLLGDFSVKIKNHTHPVIDTPPATLKIGDWCKQGLPFYSGSISYCNSFKIKKNANERTFIRIPKYRATAVRIIINETNNGIIAWEPNELEITDQLKAGKNEIKIELISHRRNSHGPLHLQEKWPAWTGPAQFNNKDNWYDGYQLVPCGLLAAPELIFKKK